MRHRASYLSRILTTIRDAGQVLGKNGSHQVEQANMQIFPPRNLAGTPSPHLRSTPHPTTTVPLILQSTQHSLSSDKYKPKVPYVPYVVWYLYRPYPAAQTPMSICRIMTHSSPTKTTFKKSIGGDKSAVEIKTTSLAVRKIQISVGLLRKWNGMLFFYMPVPSFAPRNDQMCDL